MTIRTIRLARILRIAALAGLTSLAVPLLTATSARAQTYTFDSLVQFDGTNGDGPQGNLALDSSGNIYGTSQYAGANNLGSVFEFVAGSSSVTTLVSFNNDATGDRPLSGITIDSSGNLYGSTFGQGTYSYGSVFEVSASAISAGTTAPIVLATFNANEVDGSSPIGSLLVDNSGDVYGTTPQGAHNQGSLFEVAAGSGTINDLVTFNIGNGTTPFGSLIYDSNKNIFGTTYYSSGNGALGPGTAFELSAGGTFSTLATFTSSTGINPYAGLTIDSHGNLYGTTTQGGANNLGTVFEIANTGSLAAPNYSSGVNTLLSFTSATGTATTSLLIDSSGNLYGTTSAGGDLTLNQNRGDGTVFEIAASNRGVIQNLVSFDGSNGRTPLGSLAMDSSGNLYGSTAVGGSSDNGTLFELVKQYPGFTWDGAGTDNNWSTALNWVGAVAPGPTDNDQINFDGTIRLSPNLEQPYSVNNVTFTPAAGAFTVGGAALTIGGGGITQSSTTNLQTIATSGVVLGTAQTWSDAGGGLTVSAPISGSGALTISGSGTTTISGANAYTGGTTIEGETVVVGDSSMQGASLGTGTVDLRTGLLEFQDNATTNGAAINAQNGLAPILFMGTSTASTSAIILGQDDAIEFKDSSTAGSANITNSNNGIIFSDNASAGSASIINKTTIEENPGSVQFTGNSKAASANIQNGAGNIVTFSDSSTMDSSVITLTGVNSILDINTAGGSGATVINNSVANATNAGVDISQSPSSNVAIGSLSGSGAVHLGSNTLTLGALNLNDTISGVVDNIGETGSVFGGITKVGTGTLTLLGGNYGGDTTVNAGSLIISGTGNYGSVISNAAGTTVTIDGGTIAASHSYYGGSTIINGGTINTVDASFGSTTAVNVRINGGTIGQVIAGDPVTIDIYGGSFSSAFDNEDPSQSMIVFFGTDFTLDNPAADPDGTDTDWQLTGILSDGEDLSSEYIEPGSDMTSAQGISFNDVGNASAPEPGSLAFIAAGIAAAGVTVIFSRQRRAGEMA